MSGNWNFPLIGLSDTYGAVPASSNGTLISNSYGQIASATAYEWQGLHLEYIPAITGKHTVSIGLGAAASEFDLIAELLHQAGTSTSELGARLLLPLRVPAGTRVAAKSSSASAGNAVIRGVHYGAAGAVANGAFSELAGTASTGTAVDPGTSANTKGAWTQLSASTNYPWRGLLVSFASGSTSGATVSYLADVGIGGAGSEQVIVDNMQLAKNSSNGLGPSWWGWFPCDIPAGTRVAARCQCTGTSSSSRQLAVNVHGIVA
ncbi:MAG: hypothetical protein K8U57_07455 [Planctomycetes bacterium]|nr:hypothetical protein [Planctomycetota bacterium]